MRFDEWLNRFVFEKEEVTDFKSSEAYPVHSTRRFIEKHTSRLWEIAFTYTGRLLVRSGMPSPDGTTIDWGQWETQHEVTLCVPREKNKDTCR